MYPTQDSERNPGPGAFLWPEEKTGRLIADWHRAGGHGGPDFRSADPAKRVLSDEHAAGLGWNLALSRVGGKQGWHSRARDTPLIRPSAIFSPRWGEGFDARQRAPLGTISGGLAPSGRTRRRRGPPFVSRPCWCHRKVLSENALRRFVTSPAGGPSVSYTLGGPPRHMAIANPDFMVTLGVTQHPEHSRHRNSYRNKEQSRG